MSPVVDQEMTLVDSGATVHIVPDYIANAMLAPVPLPAFVVPLAPWCHATDLDIFLQGANGSTVTILSVSYLSSCVGSSSCS